MLVNLCYKRHRQINKANAVAGLKTSSISFMKSFHNPIFTSYLEAKFGQNIVSILKLSYFGSLVTRGLTVLQQNLVSWITWNTYYVNTSFLKQILRSRVGWSVKIKKKNLDNSGWKSWNLIQIFQWYIFSEVLEDVPINY